MRTFDEILAETSNPGLPQAFSNNTHYDIWAVGWCNRCRNNGEDDDSCPIRDALFINNRTPIELKPSVAFSYNCTEFERA